MDGGRPAPVGLRSGMQRALRSRTLVLAVLASLGIVSYALHLWMSGRYAAPTSGDYGIYLADAHALMGPDVTGFGSAYPPVFLVPLLGLLTFLDPLTAVRVMTPAALLLLPFPFYFLVSRYAPKPWALLGTGLYLLNEGYSEMTGWGGGPDLLATAFMLASLVRFLRYLDSPSRRRLVWAGLFTGLVVGTHHLTALVYFVTLLVWMVAETLRARTMSGAAPFLRLAGWSALFSLPFAPFYLGFTGSLAPQITPVWPNAFLNFPASLVFLFRGSPVLWLLVGVLSVAAGVQWLRRRPEGTLFPSMAAACVLLALLVLQDNPTRSLYYLYIPLLATFPAFFRWVPSAASADFTPRTRQAVVVLLVTFAIVLSATFAGQSLERMSVAVDWYHAVNRPELAAMDWLRQNTSPDAVVATAGVPFYRFPEGTRFSWWIEGYAERRAFYGGSPIYASLDRERTMVEEANLYFAGNYGEQASGLRFADNAPAALANPSVSVHVPLGFETAFFLSDSDTVVNYVAGAGGGGNRTWSPYFAVPVVHPVWVGTDQSILSVPRGDGNVSFVRNETLEGSAVNVSLDIRAVDGTLDAISVPVWVGWWMRFASVRVDGDTVSGVLRDDAGDHVPFEASFTTNPPTLLRINATDHDPRWGQPAILVQAVAGVAQSRLTLAVHLDFPSVDPSAASRWDAFSIGAAYGVGYVFESRRLAEAYYRFSEDTQHFRLVYANAGVCIYQVVPS